MGKASRTKAERRSTEGVAEARKKTEGRPWVFPTVVGAIVVIAVIIVAVFAVGGGDDENSTASDLGQTDPQSLIGNPAPPLSGDDLVDGGTASLTDFRGKKTLVAFWAHWCPHCQSALPGVEEVWEASDGSYNVVTVATAQGQNRAESQYADAEKFIETVGLTMPTIDDPDDSSAAAWGLTGFPMYYVLDEDLVVTDLPPANTTPEQFEAMLKS